MEAKSENIQESEDENIRGLYVKRQNFRSRRLTPTFEECAMVAGQGNHNSPQVAQDPISMSTITGSSGIYGVPDHVIRANTNQTKIIILDEEITKPARNYQIKSIKRGLPENMTKDPKAQQVKYIKYRGMEITPFCVCQKKSEKSYTPSAWTFTIFTVFVCVILPLTSFSADVAFYVMCADHYNETANLLTEVRDLGWKDNTTKTPPEARKNTEVLIVRKSHRRHDSSSNSMGHQYKRSINYNVETIGSKNIYTSPIIRSFVNNNLTTTNESNSDEETPPTWFGEFRDTATTNSACLSPTDMIMYMKNETAAEMLTEHRHLTQDVFEPIFIIGSFPSLVLCILERLVIMITLHDDFLSAYVINMAGMSLGLTTGALGVYSASFHLGRDGFECWQCTLNGDCSKVGPSSWLHDHVNVSLIVATATKFFDGLAGGSVLFVVLTRKMLKGPRRNVMFWRRIGKMLLLIISFFLCHIISALLLVTPAIAAFRLTFLDKIPDFAEKENLSYALMFVLGLGLAAWALSLFTIFIYLIYRTCLYCRRKEHAVIFVK